MSCFFFRTLVVIGFFLIFPYCRDRQTVLLSFLLTGLSLDTAAALKLRREPDDLAAVKAGAGEGRVAVVQDQPAAAGAVR